MIFDFFTQTFDVYIYGSGIANIFISPDMVKKLLSCKYLIWRGCQKIEQFQFFWRHIHLSAHIGDRIVGKIDRQIRETYTFFIRVTGWLTNLETAENGAYTGNQFLCVKRLDDIVVGTKFQTENFVKSFSFGRKHNDRNVGIVTDFATDLITVDSRKHQIEQNQVRMKSIEFFQCLFSVIYDSGFKTFFCKI